jgi:hypothetical protein
VIYRRLIIAVIIVSLIACMPQDNLLNHVKQINTPFTITDSTTGFFAITDSLRFDTVIVKQFGLTEDLKSGGTYLPK